MSNEAIKKLIEEFLGRLQITFEQIEIIEDIDAHPIFFVRTAESHLLIGAHGDNLRALNTLAKQIVWKMQGGDESAKPNFLIDVNGYHTRHLRELKKTARTMAERVRMFRASIEMSPMNAYDRMIVHSTFANDPEIATESEGEGKFRRVIIKIRPKDAS